MHTHLQTIASNSNLYAGANARALLRNNIEAPYMPEITLPDPNYTKRARVKVPWPDEEKKSTTDLIEISETKFYPNPSQGDFNAEIKLIAEKAILKVLDLSGKVVFQQNLIQGNQKVVIPTRQWAKGMYLGQIEVEGKVIFEEKLTLK